MVKEFVSQVLEGNMTLSKDAEATISARLAQIDRLISIQLNEVMHHPSFQKLEATWRGIKYLMDQSETNDGLKIKVLNASKKELLRDLQRAPEFDQSALFKKAYEEEFGVFGGAPFAALVGDYEFGKGPEDMELLERVSARWPRLRTLLSFRRQLAGADEPERLYATGCAARHVEGLRQHGVCQVEEFPAVGRLALCGADAAAHPDALAVWQGNQGDRGL